MPGTPIVAVTFVLLVAGVLASTRHRIPGTALSLVGIGLYWWRSGFAEPPDVTAGLLALVGLLGIIGHVYGRSIAPRIETTSRVTATLAAIVGIVAFPFAGTSGFLGGMSITAFVLAYLRYRSLKGGFVGAVSVVLRSFASELMQMLLSGALLFVMVQVVFF